MGCGRRGRAGARSRRPPAPPRRPAPAAATTTVRAAIRARWAGFCTPLAESSGPVPGNTRRRTRPARRSARRRRAGPGSSCSGASRPDRPGTQPPHSPAVPRLIPQAFRAHLGSAAPDVGARVSSDPAASRNGYAALGRVLDLGAGFNFAFFYGGLKRGVVAFVLVGVGFGEAGD